ncbi:Histidine decarboxylase, partial [Armadillidium nasatum]
ASSPACTELEIIVMDWLAKMIGLPEQFLHRGEKSTGGGVIQTTASEATFVCLLAARTEAILKYQNEYPDIEDAEINSRLVAYCSDQAHSSVEKAGLIGLVKLRYIESDDNLSMRGDKVVEAIKCDREKGLIPFFLCATLGTTGACSFDNLLELGPICEEEDLWMHVDAAYAGTAFICPEFRHFMKGIEYASSLAFNPSKWMMVHFDCTAMWYVYMNITYYISHTTYLNTYHSYGVRMAQKFEAFLKSDQRFEIPAARHLGMVVFRLKGENELTEKLLKKLNSSGKLHCVPASLKGKYVIRYTVTSTRTTAEDITRDWAIIKYIASEVLEINANDEQKPKVFLKAMKRRIKGMLMASKQYSLDSRMDIVQTIVSSATSGNYETLPTMRETSVEHDHYSSRENMADTGLYR